MSKKVISLLLAVCMIFCLSACGGTETNNDSSDKSSESQKDNPFESQKDKQSSTNKTSSVQSANSQVSSDDEDADRDDSSQGESSEKQSKPTSTTTPNSHTHSYSNATCTSPKTCTRCEQTSGSALGHNYVNNKCSRCGKTDPDSLPVGLEQLHVIDSNSDYYSFKNETIQDTFGNKYVGYHRFKEVGETAYAIFNLNYKYSIFSCDIITTCKDATFAIYVDNVLKYQTTNLSNVSGPIHVDVDVKNGQQLKVVATDNTYSWSVAGCLVNAQLTK